VGSELCPVYQGCHALTFALPRLSCVSNEYGIIMLDNVEIGTSQLGESRNALKG